jgi:hypothetical protein
MLASVQPVLHRAAVLTSQPLGSRWIPGEGCRIGGQRATSSVLFARAVSIAETKAGAGKADRVQEASHSQ